MTTDIPLLAGAKSIRMSLAISVKKALPGENSGGIICGI
jgi:hypothetical protein